MTDNINQRLLQDFAVRHAPHSGRRDDGVKAKPRKVKVWSHQDQLKEWVGKEINFSMLTPTGLVVMTTTLLAADPYTLLIKRGDKEAILFKSSIVDIALA